MNRSLPLAILFAAVAACGLAPGIHMRDAEVTDRAHEQGNTAFEINQVSPFVIARLATEQAAATAARHADPNVADFATYQYRIAPLDVLSVVVWDHPELTSPAGQYQSPDSNGLLVYADGTMFYPFVGYLRVSGRTVIEVQQELTGRLRGAIQDPQVSVRVASFRGKRVEVTGEVKKPGTKSMYRGRLNLAQALGDSEGFDYATMKPAVYVFREKSLGRPEIFRLDVSSAEALLLAAQFPPRGEPDCTFRQHDLADLERRDDVEGDVGL